MQDAAPLRAHSKPHDLARLFAPVARFFSSLANHALPESGSRRRISYGVLGLLAIVTFRMIVGWGTWGDVSIDGGHESYVPAVLAHGKMLYRDVWYHYGPAGPYFNGWLFRLFGVHLAVLYLAGASSALSSAIFLFFCGIELGYPLAGWTAGAALAIEAFEPGYFSFPWPYSFAAVYGCACACLFLWILLRSLRSPNVAWILVAGCLAGVGLLLKLEYGTAFFGTLGVVIALRAVVNWTAKKLAFDLAMALPGLVFCILVIGWMISIRGIEFITQENIMSWPSSYFMRTFGAGWLAHTGFAFNLPVLLGVYLQTLFAAAWVFVISVLVRSGHPLRRIGFAVFAVGLSVCCGVFFPFFGFARLLSGIFFPPPMVFYVVLGALGTAMFMLSNPPGTKLLPLFVTFVFSGVLAFRILFYTTAYRYSVYYNGPVILAYLILVQNLGKQWTQKNQDARRLAVVVCCGCLIAVAAESVSAGLRREPNVKLETAYGTLRVPEPVATNYREGIKFLQAHNSNGQSVLVLPEDTTLYFLSGTEAPTRVYGFTPGIVAPGPMTVQLLNDIDRKKIDYLLWSNRQFPEYGTPVFGKDFNVELADYFKKNYSPIGPLVREEPDPAKLSFTVWQRKGDAGPK